MALIDEIKIDLGYRWTDEFTDSLIEQYVEDGKAYLSDHKPTVDFESPGLAKKLLKEYVRYCVAGALPDFKINYKKEIVRLSNKGMIERRKKEADNDDGI